MLFLRPQATHTRNDALRLVIVVLILLPVALVLLG
jgi:hypothetical protein